MTVGIGYRQRAIENAAALTPGYVVEFSRLVDLGMVFKWDASGPKAGLSNFQNALPEFTYLALDEQPVRLYIKRTRPGVQPPIWDPGPAMPDFTLQQLLDSEGAAAQSAQTAITKAAAANASALSATGSAIAASMSQTAARGSATAAALSAATAVALVGVQLPLPIPLALKSLLAATMGMLPTSPPDGAGQPWLDNGVLVFTPSTPADNAAAIAAANAVNQNQLNPAQVAVLLQGMAASLPTDMPDGAGQPWLNNNVLAFTS
ncbi:hypothetical protein [Methylobacterium fujisawaense]